MVANVRAGTVGTSIVDDEDGGDFGSDAGEDVEDMLDLAVAWHDHGNGRDRLVHGFAGHRGIRLDWQTLTGGDSRRNSARRLPNQRVA